MTSSWTITGLLALVLVACGASQSGGQPTGASQATTPGSTKAAASIAPGENPPPATAGSLPAACDLLTAAEVGSALGKAVGEGTALGKFICEWKVDPESLSVDVSLLAQTMPDEYCEPALTGEATTGFGRASKWDYSDSFNVPQGSLSACVSGGLVSVTLTGDMGGPSDPAGYRTRAETLLTLALGRL